VIDQAGSAARFGAKQKAAARQGKPAVGPSKSRPAAKQRSAGTQTKGRLQAFFRHVSS
jgi:hypothetical protein